MASTATTYINNISASYPVAGQDNDTQGFRDNFSNIKNSTTILAKEISDIQTNGVFANQTTDFYQTGVIANGNFQAVGDVIAPGHWLQSSGGSLNLDYTEGNYQKWHLNTNTSFTVVNWPVPNIKARIEVEMKKDPTHVGNISVNFINPSPTGHVYPDFGSSVTLPVSLTTSSSVIYEISSTDGGETQFVRFLGGPFK
jgi:hypothetical protein